MNFVCLSPNFPPNFQSFWLRLRAAGVNVLGLGDTPVEGLGWIGDVLTDYFRVSDMHNMHEMIKALGYFTFKYGKIDRIESHNEYWLETDAALRTDFNVPGPHRDTIQHVKRKSLMKEKFRQAGVAVAQGKVVNNRHEAEQLAEELGYPLVAKPDIGVGAAGAVRIKSREHLAEFFARKPPVDYILEECLTGMLCSFDGLVDASGHIVFYTSHVFSEGVMDIVTNDDDMFYYSIREVPADLEQAGRAALTAFELRERFFHIEFFRREFEPALVAMEINMRPPGGLTTDMFNFANNIDVYEDYAKVVTGGHVESHGTRPYHCMYIGRKNHIHYRHSIEDILHYADGLVVHHQPVQSVFAPAIGDYAVLARHPDLEPLTDLIGYVLEA